MAPHVASLLYDAREPMTLFELQTWLGHRSPEATQHHAKIPPDTLAGACNDARCFARSVRTIEVLIDHDAVTSGAHHSRRADRPDLRASADKRRKDRAERRGGVRAITTGRPRFVAIEVKLLG